MPRLIQVAGVLTILALVFILANAEPEGRIFWHLLTIHDAPAAGVMLAILVFGVGAGRYWRGGASWIERLVLELERWRLVVAGVVWVVLAYGALAVYRNHPLSMDEYAAYFQAQVFAAGALHGQFPPELIDYLLPRQFQNHFLMVNRDTGAVFSAYWPGYALLLTPFVALGMPWACNPTIVALSLLLIARVTRRLVRAPAAPGWAMLFALASPAFSINGISYYSMAAHLLFNLLFAYLLLPPSALRLILAGVVGGFALVLHNPFPHLVFAVPWIVWLAMQRGQRLRNLAWLGAGYLPVVLVLGLGWMLWQQQTLQPGVAAATTVAPATSVMSIVDRASRLVSGLFRHIQLPGELIVYARVAGLAKLWLWASPLLLLLAWQGGRREQDAGLRLLGASALLTFFAYFAIRFDQGHGWGYRYFHSAWGALPVLAAVGVAKLAAATHERARTLNSLAIVTLLSLVGMNGLRFVQVGDFIAAHLAQRPPMNATGRQIIFHNGRGYYAIDLIQNDPWLRGPKIILLSDRPADEPALVARHFPGEYSVERNRFGTTYFQRQPAAEFTGATPAR